jgi:hypothetical protein
MGCSHCGTRKRPTFSRTIGETSPRTVWESTELAPDHTICWETIADLVSRDIVATLQADEAFLIATTPTSSTRGSNPPSVPNSPEVAEIPIPWIQPFWSSITLRRRRMIHFVDYVPTIELSRVTCGRTAQINYSSSTFPCSALPIVLLPDPISWIRPIFRSGTLHKLCEHFWKQRSQRIL